MKAYARSIGLQFGHFAFFAKWLALAVPVGFVVGSLCAAFLIGLDQATAARFDQPWLLFGLPFAGAAMAFVYLKFGGSADGGNNLIVEQIHEPGGGVPLRMAPLIFITTIGTHLFGGSAGREGTAVQLGGSVAGGFARLFRLPPAEVRILLMAGVAAGFGAVFGTPVAGAIFALEVLAIGRLKYDALIPCLIAAITGDWICHAWGVGHIHYSLSFIPSADGFTLDGFLLLQVALAGIAFGLCARLFSVLSHLTLHLFKTVAPYAPLRAFLGGLLVIGLVYAVGTREYLGLGVWSPNPDDVTISSFFDAGFDDSWSWAWKALFTIVTLSAGFKGGEVTPLFFIGAGLGHALAIVLGAPVDLFAALGFIAVFAGATNTPLACFIMGIELFGAANSVYFAVACFLAYFFSGHSSIYLSQRIGVPKSAAPHIPVDVTLRELQLQNPSHFARLTRAIWHRRKGTSGRAPATQPSEDTK